MKYRYLVGLYEEQYNMIIRMINKFNPLFLYRDEYTDKINALVRVIERKYRPILTWLDSLKKGSV